MRDRSAENPLLVGALGYAKRNWPVLPCAERDKRPITAHGHKDATTDRGKLIAHWKARPNANVAIATGSQSGLLVLDVDPRNGGDESLRSLERQHGELPPTLVVETGGGGVHYYFAVPRERVASFVLAEGLDVKGDGGYVVAPPSIHPSGGRYKWRTPPAQTTLAPAPEWLLRRRRPKSLPLKEANPQPVAKASETPLGRMFSECGLLGKALDGGKYAVVCPWQNEHTTGKQLDSSTVIFPAASSGGLGGFHCSHAHCSGRSSKDAFDALHRKVDASQAERAWMADLSRNKEGRLLRSFRNVCLILKHDPAYGPSLRFNEMQSTVLLGEQEMRDSGISAVRVDLDERYGIAPSEADSVRAVQFVAERNKFHPVRTYLRTLRWDGVPRIARVAQEILRIPVSSPEDVELLSLLVRRWFISLVARPLQPGIKVDSVLILAGGQGVGKSTFFRLLGGEWFSDTEMALDKDGLMLLCGSWILEWAELENVFGRNTTSRVKQFVTSNSDRFRPPFGRTPITVAVPPSS